jgi:hypothetical protein
MVKSKGKKSIELSGKSPCILGSLHSVPGCDLRARYPLLEYSS